MLKCIVCNQEAEYIYFGKSLCKQHFMELVNEIDAAELKKIKEEVEEAYYSGDKS